MKRLFSLLKCHPALLADMVRQVRPLLGRRKTDLLMAAVVLLLLFAEKVSFSTCSQL